MVSQRQLLETIRSTAESVLNVSVITDISNIPSFPYLVLYPIAGGSFSGPPFVAPDADADMVIQGSSVGARSDQALHLSDSFRALMLGRNSDGAFDVTIPGIATRRPYGGPPGIDPEGSAGEHVYTVAERFIISIVS